MSQATIVEHKQAFLRQQKQILVKRIAPSPKLLQIAERSGIQTKVLGDVLHKVNRDLRRQGKLVHNRQMTDHVVEQIDLLYWESGAPSIEENRSSTNEDGTESNDLLYQGDNLTLDRYISKLPATWDTSADPPVEVQDAENEATRDTYITSVVRLQDLSAKRLLLQQKLSTYRTLLSLLEPYRQPQKNIQSNLVGKDAPISVELTKARTLAIRVAGRVAEKYGDIEVPATADDEDVELDEADGNSKLDAILKSW